MRPTQKRGSPLNVPGSWRGVRKGLQEAPPEVQVYFEPVGQLIEYYPWEVSLSYLFAKLERAHLMSIYCGVVKLHRADAALARKAVDAFQHTGGISIHVRERF